MERQRHDFAQSPNCQTPSPSGWLDRCSKIVESSQMLRNVYITERLRVLACLVLALSVALFPPSAAHATAKSGAASHVHSVTMGTNDTHQSLHEPSAETGNMASCKSDAHMSHSGSGSDQCCSGICLNAVLGEDPSLRDTAFSSRDYKLGSTQMTHVDPNGFLRPPRQLI